MLKKMDVWVKRGLAVLIGGIIFYLTLLSAFSTSAVEERNFAAMAGESDIGYYNFYLSDNVLLHIIVLFVFILIITAVERKIKDRNNYIPKKIEWINCLVFFIVGMLWIFSTRMHPISDQQKILSIAEQMSLGDFTQFRVNEGYLWRYPDQMGIVFFYYLIVTVFGKFSYLVIQVCNLLAATIALFIVKQLADLIFSTGSDKKIGIGVQFAYMLFVPYLLYITFIYGTILGFSFSIYAIYNEVQFLQKRKMRYVILSVLFISLAVVFKTNSLIMMIAMLLFLLYDIIMETRKKESLFFVVMILLTYFIFTQGIQLFMSNLSGYEVSRGMPKTNWIAMALQESRYAPGTWNGYSVHLYEDANYVYEDANKLAVNSIKKSLKSFMNDKSEAVRWLGKKLAVQWNEPGFGAIEISRNRMESIDIPKVVASIVYGRAGYIILAYLNFLQTIVLFGSFMYFTLSNCKNIKRESLLLGVAMMGGFAFHIFWEAKNQYVLPYFLLILPYSVKGYQLLVYRISNLLDGLKGRYLHFCKRVVFNIVLILALTAVLSSTRVFQYMIAVKDEPELCMLYKKTVEENIMETDRKYNE